METNLYEKIIDIDKRANKIGVAISLLCRDAGISNSTFSRWKAKKNRPTMDSYMKLLSALEKTELNKVIS